MWIRVRAAMRLAAVFVFAIAAFGASLSGASNVQFAGNVGYTYAGSTAVLNSDRVDNFTSSGNSGTLHMELWAFPSAYNGNAQVGYKLAQHSLGQLQGLHYFYGISSGPIGFSLPPSGTWVAVMMLTEFDGSTFNGGYGVRDWHNFTQPIVVGTPTPPGQLSFVPSIAFGNQTVGTTSTARTVVVTNVGGRTVNFYEAGLTNTLDFSAFTGCSAVLTPGASCTGTVYFTPHATGTLTGAVVVTSDGLGSPQYIQLSGVGVSVAPPPPPPPPATSIAIEYYHAGFDHYFMTAITDEITKLDNGTFTGWARTGRSLKVYASNQSGTSSVCRFFSTAFSPKSSHFYTPDATECSVVKSNANWQFEAVVFYAAKPDLAGNCPASSQQVFRLYNNGQGAAPNHRYTTSTIIRSQMLSQGWIPEGYGALGVIMCAPL